MSVLDISKVPEEASVSRTEQALRLFASRVEQIPGVVRTGRYHAGGLEEEGIMVFVTDLFSSITHEVIRAQELVYAAIPGIRFSIDIKDVSTAGQNDK